MSEPKGTSRAARNLAMKGVLSLEPATVSGGSSEETRERDLRRLKRETAAREEAERLLEAKSLELFQANEQLRELNADLSTKICETENHIKRAEYAAHHDEVTGIPNRRAIFEHLASLVHHDCSLLLLGVDHFKSINDTLGHAAGDIVLRVVGDYLQMLCAPDVFFGRFGGDEFVLVVPEHGMINRGAALAQTIQTELSEGAFYKGVCARFTLSIGMSHRHEEQEKSEDIFLEADLALYRAKEIGRSCIVRFTNEMRAKAERRRLLSGLIFEALQQRQFQPYYMPRIDARTGRIPCVETLARWTSPRLGPVSPADFLSVAQEIGCVEQIDRQMLESAVADLIVFEGAQFHIPKVSVNVSSRRMMEQGLLEEIEALDFSSGSLSFELLESVFLDDPGQEVMERLESLRRFGIGLEIDDFGSGHASINGLLSVRPDALKIDGSLVIDALDNPPRVELLSSIVAIGRALGIAVVAEGVETEAHIELCRRVGCDQLQGWAIARPMPAGDLMTWQENWNANYVKNWKTH